MGAGVGEVAHLEFDGAEVGEGEGVVGGGGEDFQVGFAGGFPVAGADGVGGDFGEA